MSKIIADRMTAQIDGDFIVFLIGMRINKPWKIHKWLPVFLAMPRMLAELDASPREQTGFLGRNGLSIGGPIVQYWRSFDHLERYAKSKDHEHFSAWQAFNQRMKNAREDVGIWHETYLVKAGQYETLYSGMPEYGLGKVSTLASATGNRADARSRLGHGPS